MAPTGWVTTNMPSSSETTPLRMRPSLSKTSFGVAGDGRLLDDLLVRFTRGSAACDFQPAKPRTEIATTMSVR